MNPGDNRDNIASDYLSTLESLPDKQRRRFFEGEWSPEIEGALWTLDSIDRNRIEARQGSTLDSLLESGAVPSLKWVVVAVDPSGASGREGERSDEIGIVVAGLGTDGIGYVLADRSARLGPAQWARLAVTAYHEFRADRIVAERSFGGAHGERRLRWREKPRPPRRPRVGALGVDARPTRSPAGRFGCKRDRSGASPSSPGSA